MLTVSQPREVIKNPYLFLRTPLQFKVKPEAVIGAEHRRKMMMMMMEVDDVIMVLLINENEGNFSLPCAHRRTVFFFFWLPSAGPYCDILIDKLTVF